MLFWVSAISQTSYCIQLMTSNVECEEARDLKERLKERQLDHNYTQKRKRNQWRKTLKVFVKQADLTCSLARCREYDKKRHAG